MRDCQLLLERPNWQDHRALAPGSSHVFLLFISLAIFLILVLCSQRGGLTLSFSVDRPPYQHAACGGQVDPPICVGVTALFCGSPSASIDPGFDLAPRPSSLPLLSALEAGCLSSCLSWWRGGGEREVEEGGGGKKKGGSLGDHEGALSGSTDLLPAPGPSTDWISSLVTDSGRDSDLISASPEPGGQEMNRHHYSLYVHYCRLVFDLTFFLVFLLTCPVNSSGIQRGS
ncbi:hypothetical protein NHX12_008560, partial [Muraenolepis orangiensis]